MIVRELLTKLGFQLDNAAINRAEQATNRIRNRADFAANAFRKIALSIASIATVQGLIKIGDTMQSIRARIEQLPQTVIEAGEAFDVVADHAIAARAPIEAYASLYSRLGNAAKDYVKTQEDLLGITDTISKALVVGGATAQEAGSVMIQFSQALGAGTLQGEEFRAMAEAAPQYMDQLALALGKPRSELKKLASEGKITSKDVIEATRKMAVHFDDKFKKMPMTVGQAMIIVNNRFSRMIDRMNRESMFITKIADTIIKGFDAIESGISKTINAFGGFNTAIRLVATAVAVSLIPQIVKLATVSAIPILHWLAIAAAILLATLAIEDFYVWTQGGASIIGDMVGPWEEWSGVVIGTLNFIKTGLRQIGELAGTVAAILVGAFTLDFSLVKEAMRGFGNLITKGAINPEAQKLWYQQQGVNQQSMSGDKYNSVTNNTTVNLTVPAGTPQEQANFLVNASEKYFGSKDKYPSSTDMAVLAP